MSTAVFVISMWRVNSYGGKYDSRACSMCMAITTNLVFCIATIHKSNIRSPHSSIQWIDAH